ncbi:MAG TPA: glucosamine-6-phosphate deaminase [Flavitalea sp.]|nr:glucosamine-6-phosphate deaminase [Flavitalea sp.]
MLLKIHESYNAMSSAAADMIIDTVNKNPNALLCFATGDTPKLTYQTLQEIAKGKEVNFSKCFFIGLDEWLGIPPQNTGSCHYFLHHFLFQPLSIDPSRIHLFNAMTGDEEQECRTMNKLLQDKGPIDFMLVGIGMNGHIGFNEPGTDPGSTAHVSMLDSTTQTVGKKYFQQEVTISKGITLGLKQVMDSRKLLMIANGKKKAGVIKKTVEGGISSDFPASLVRDHKNSILMVDKEAASELEHHTNEK